ncbi:MULTISPECIES: LysR family transcriptional regulator [unclassified Leisingera]|uniref:LysR family transcriptional regulator n=1 Tax=unclassified Leisingera TaxID=2614906 RepID=UPI00031B3907|nr:MULTISPECIES: LysR family transcriptional regulator [unclassified Leisingera]KIC25595.1 LysR family transcriptional regulator [Leisingera sp. ANG-S3]KIC54301.1 LysR family transcriptional regulator [Leisingera sp. ANG-S]KID10878.1 LysR family transcriptional regulator [Leisingera sp. ANG1]
MPSSGSPSSSLPPLTWLRAFEASARHLSFTRAAAELNLTQSAISQHVRSLENFLGRELFIRKTRALELSEAGANYMPIVREAFDLIAAGTQAFTGGDQGRHLVLQCNMAFSVFWLSPRLPRLYERFPWLVLNIVTPIWDPERHASSAGTEIRFGRPNDMSAAAVRLTYDRFYPVCAPGYQDGKVDFNSATLLDCAGVTGSWGAWFKSQDLPFERNHEVNLASTYVIAMTAAVNGAGMAMSHDTLAEGLLESGQLVRASDHSAELLENYFLMPPPSHASTPASRAFLEWLVGELPPV